MKQTGRNGKNFPAFLNRALPVIYFFFVFFLYFSFLSDPYFTDEQDVFYGAYHIVKGRDIYQSFLSQHMPFSYYFVALAALCGARTVFQFRLGTYVLLAVLWESVYLRHRKTFHPVSLFGMPLLYLFMLRTQYLGTTMLSDHWQGIGLLLILLELVRYTETKEISLSCAVMVSLGIVLSLGSSFASAYAVFCYFLAMVTVQLTAWLHGRKYGVPAGAGKEGTLFRQNARLIIVCLLPFALLLGWYAATGNVGNCISGVYEIITEHYSKYISGFGSDPVRVVWETVWLYGRYLLNAARNLGSAPWPGLMYLLAAAGLAVFCVLIGKKSPAAGLLTFLAAVYGGIRDFEGFHAMAYYAQAAGALALLAGRAARLCRDRGRMRWAFAGTAGALAALMLVNFVVWAGYNLLYPQILLDRNLRCEEQILDLLTDPDDTVYACNQPVSSLDVMDLELIPEDACGALSYPYFYEMWGDRAMESIRRNPGILIYNGDEISWGQAFREYAPDFDAYVQANYTKLPQTEEIWVSGEFLPEALRRLEDNGYGDLVVSNVRDRMANYPKEYYAGQSVKTRFTAEAENLSAVRFCAACFHRRSIPVLTLRVTDPDTGDVLAEGTVTGDGIGDNFFSRCPMEGRLVSGKDYNLEILVERIDGKGDMEFYFTPEGEPALAVEYELNP